jgi:hypothetical protein
MKILKMEKGKAQKKKNLARLNWHMRGEYLNWSFRQTPQLLRLE